jgi:hypothetical protein
MVVVVMVVAVVKHQGKLILEPSQPPFPSLLALPATAAPRRARCLLE